MKSGNSSVARRMTLGVMVCGLAVACALTMGCKEKAPPPAPPPPPPPPPAAPPEVSFSSIFNELKVDPRVEAREGLGVTDASFARSAAMLADALARGDADKFGALLTRPSQRVLAELKSNGGWASETGAIERVRIVYASNPGAMSDMERDQAIAAIEAVNERRLRERFEGLRSIGEKEEDANRIVNGLREELAADLARLRARSAASTFGENRPEMVLLLAYQTPAGAQVMGWTGARAGDGWVFNQARTVGTTYANVSEFDALGMLAFSTTDDEARPGTAGGSAGGGGTAMPGLNDARPVVLAVTVAASMKLMGMTAEPGSPIEQGMLAQMAAQFNSTPEQIATRLREGRTALDNGEKINAKEATELLAGFKVLAGTLKAGTGEEEVIRLLAEAAKMTVEEFKALLAQGGSSGSAAPATPGGALPR